MSPVGTVDNPLRVAIVGAGPTGFYAAGHLFKQSQFVVAVDMLERLPTPYGLVRYGVAPDHQKIKSVQKLFDRTAQNPHFRFLGNVDVGQDITVAELKQYYHQILFTTGAQSDRRLNIPGEDLANSHSATEFVAWYNGHPDFRHLTFDLSQSRAVVIGVGNVAIDVARILCRTPEELAVTDIADYALEALRASRIQEVIVAGRRGPAQAAFTSPEVKEIGELADAEVFVVPEEVTLDPLSAEDVAAGDRETRTKVEYLQQFVHRSPAGKSRRLTLRFLVSPTEVVGDEKSRVSAIRVVKNKLYRNEKGDLRPRATDETELWPVGLVFRSIGYRGIPIPGVPFHERWGVINNEAGRVTDTETGEAVTGLYAAGWIKRGPTGIIGTNKPDALETVEHMLADATEGRILAPSADSGDDIRALLDVRKPTVISFADWQRLDAIELARGEAQNRARVKFTSLEEIQDALAMPVADL